MKRAALSRRVKELLAREASDPEAIAKGFESLLGSIERKRRGTFFTPPAVARALARRTVAGLERGVVLDPACGAGALLAAASEVVPPAVELVGIDADPDAVLLARARLAGRPNVRILHGDSLAIPAAELPRAAAVLANPPFVATYARGAQRLGAARRAFLAERFPGLGAGERNAFLHFLALGLELAGEQGRLGFVVPDTLLVNERYERVRRLLLRGSVEALLLDWAVFGEASVRTALVVVRGVVRDVASEARPALRVEVYDSERALEEARPTARQDLTRKALEQRPAFAFPRGATDTGLEAKIRSRGTPLGDLCWVRDGINPGPRAFREKILSTDPARGRPCLEGKDVHPFELGAPRLFVDTDPALLTPELKRRGASFREAWIFDSEKLVSRQTSPTLVFARDPGGARLLNSAHATGRLEETEESLLYFLAVLNSRALRWYYARSSGETRRVFPQVHVSALRRLPIPRAGDAHDAIVALAKRLERAPGDQAALAAVDEHVFDLLDLRSAERRVASV